MQYLFILVACCGIVLQSLSVPVNAQQHHPIFTIDSPHDFSTLVIKPPEAKLNNLFIQFTASDAPENSEICIIISAFGALAQNKPEQCVSSTANHIALSGLNPGHYVFQFIIKKATDPVEYYFDTLEVLRVSIKTVEESLPELEFSNPGELFFIQPENAESVDVMLDLAIAESMLYDVLDLCVVVTEITEIETDTGTATEAETAISDVCTSLSGTPAAGSSLSFSLPQLSPGRYTASLLLQGTATATSPPKRFTHSKRSTRFRVVTKADTLPQLVPPTNNVEYALALDQWEVAVDVPYSVMAKDASILQADNVQVCVRHYTPVSESEGEGDAQSRANGCVPVLSTGGKGVLNAGMFGEGVHHYELGLQEGGLWLASAPKVKGIIDVRKPQEFVPTFDWQPLHAWHTAPKGIEIRLPVGGTGLKEARVPQPWRLQLSMPHPCKFFLRLDTFPHTTVTTIREAAAQKCQVAPHCLLLEAASGVEDAPHFEFADTDTVLSTLMFQKKIVLEFNSSCVEDDNEEDEDFAT